MVKDVPKLDENWQASLHCHHAYVCKIGVSRPSRLFAVHLVAKDGHTDVRRYILPHSITLFNSVGTVYKRNLIKMYYCVNNQNQIFISFTYGERMTEIAMARRCDDQKV